MADIKSVEDRSRNMAAIKSKNTSPELFIRRLLFAKGYRYRLYPKSLPGHPDLWLKKYNTAIFVHGCFWHRHTGCKYSYMPKSREDYWKSKFERNVDHDETVRKQLLDMGIKVLVIWECTIKKTQKKNGEPKVLIADIEAFLRTDKLFTEL